MAKVPHELPVAKDIAAAEEDECRNDESGDVALQHLDDEIRGAHFAQQATQCPSEN